MTTTAPPQLRRGTCQATPGVREWWEDPADRQAAAGLCTEFCPVLNECVTWSVHGVPASDSGVWGGFTQAQRARLARAADAPNPRAPVSAWLPRI